MGLQGAQGVEGPVGPRGDTGPSGEEIRLAANLHDINHCILPYMNTVLIFKPFS